ncbi:hypothetical protein NMY22_g16935 [Coprinellus aureogranulatus]|nr:hypothetical protein NMY22_g16935 [Coprinellus aureogranulatus]
MEEGGTGGKTRSHRQIRPAGDEGSDDSHQANVDRNLSIYSLYRRDTRSRINSYVPRVPLQPNIGQGVGVAQSRQGHHRRQTSDFSLVSNGSELTLVHSNASHLDLDLEKGKGPHGKSKLGQLDDSSSFDLHPDKELPVPPVTPTPRRVLRRTGLCCGLCCFATLILLCLCAVSFMMLAVNANLDGWGHRDVVHMPFGFKSPRPHKAPGDGGGDAGGKSTKSVLFKVVPTVTATSSEIALNQVGWRILDGPLTSGAALLSTLREDPGAHQEGLVGHA